MNDVPTRYEPGPVPGSRVFRGIADVKALWRSVLEHGPIRIFPIVWRTVAGRGHHVADRRFDRRYAVDTCALVGADEILKPEYRERAGILYQACPTLAIRSYLAAVPGRRSDFVLVDFGSGKGRVVLLGALLGFKKAVGVEFGEGLVATARRNFRNLRQRAPDCADAESVCIDALEFPIPEDPCVFFFFHPFEAKVLAEVLGRIEASYRANPRRMHVIYVYPLAKEIFDRQAFLRRVERKPPLLMRLLPCPFDVVCYDTAP